MTDLVGAAAHAPASGEAAAARADDLHRRYRKGVLEYCVRQLRSREEGEDAAQTVFLNAYRSLAKGVEPQSERAWLFAIAAHVVSHRRRTNSRRLRFEVPVDADDLAYLAVAPSPEDAPDLTGLVAALSEMPALQRRALLLREWRGLSYQEVASELGVSGTVVETLLARGRRRLADRMPDLRRTGKRRVLGLCLPWPSFQSLLGSGAAVKGLAGVASVVLVTVALPLDGPAPRTPVRPVVVSRAVVSPARSAHRLRPTSRSVAPAHVASRRAHTRARMAPHPVSWASSPAPTIPTETPAGDAVPDTAAAAVSTSAVQTAGPSAGAPDQSQRSLDSDPAGTTVTPPAPTPPDQSNAGGGPNARGAAAAANRSSSADGTVDSAG